MSKVYESLDTKIIIDSETGEVLQQEVSTKVIKRVAQEDFIQVYLEDLAALLNVTAISEIRVLMVLWRMASFNKENDKAGNRIVLVKPIKEEIATELNLTAGTIDNILRKLLNKNLIIKIDRTIYTLNPQYFFKGYMKDRLKVVKTIIEYHIAPSE
jgi:DNA-binding MarR family transcriptional regulator